MTKTNKKNTAVKKKATASTKTVTAKKKSVVAKKAAAKKVAAKKSVAAKAKTAEVKVATKAVSKKATTVKAKTEPKKEEHIHPVTGVKTTGHAWDGIEEFNNPLPRWWLWTFFACIIFSAGYALYYPTIPMPGAEGGRYEGLGKWTSIKQMEEGIQKGENAKKEFNDNVARMSARQIENDAELSEFAIAGGKALFALHCSQCHGSSAQGGKGYPSFLDDEWLWGSKIEDVVYTITNGIRHYDNDNTRTNDMMAYGEEEVLSNREIKDVARYIKVISEGFAENESSDRGAEVFAENCTSCHGEQGEGITEMGAPALNNAVWLYGGRIEDIIETVTGGRGGHMPAWGEKLSTDDIKKLAVFVRSLSGASN